jgi:hypothetical protein
VARPRIDTAVGNAAFAKLDPKLGSIRHRLRCPRHPEPIDSQQICRIGSNCQQNPAIGGGVLLEMTWRSPEDMSGAAFIDRDRDPGSQPAP